MGDRSTDYKSTALKTLQEVVENTLNFHLFECGQGNETSERHRVKNIRVRELRTHM